MKTSLLAYSLYGLKFLSYNPRKMVEMTNDTYYLAKISKLLYVQAPEPPVDKCLNQKRFTIKLIR
jgi:hypothetical protein